MMLELKLWELSLTMSQFLDHNAAESWDLATQAHTGLLVIGWSGLGDMHSL